MGKFLTLQDTADMLGIHVRTVRRLIQRNELKAYKIAGCVRVNEDDLQDYLTGSVIEVDKSSQIQRFTYRTGDRLV